MIPTQYDVPPELVTLLKLHEGYRTRAYQDTLGNWTVGIGRNLNSPGLSKNEVIALLQAVDMPANMVMMLLDNDIQTVAHQVAGVIGDDVWPTLNLPRQAALIDMGFMGPAKLARFEKMIAAIRTGQWGVASAEALNSVWAQQVGDRAKMVANMITTGEWPVFAEWF